MKQAIPQDAPLLPNGRFAISWQRFFIALNSSAAGTVTTVSITPANGISGTVTNPTTTPAIALALGSITPTQVTCTGTVTGTNLSGTNTGDQTISIGGDGTASGGGGALTLAVTKVNGVSFASLATGILKNTTATGVPSIAIAGTDYVAPGGALGTPSSGTLTNCTFPTLNQNTTGTASNVTGIVLGANGGTGIANTGKTITLGGNLTTSGAFASVFTMTNTTTVTFPVTGTLATLAGAEALSNKTITASTFAGTTVAATTSILSSGAGGVGYSTGAGGAVTQLTSKATGVTLSKTCGQITMSAASLAASTTVSFTLTNTLIAATDTVDVHRASGGTAAAYNVWADSVAAGSCVICVRNISAGALLEAVVLNFSICKAVNA